MRITDRIRNELDARSRILQRETIICDLLTQLIPLLEADSDVTKKESKTHVSNLICSLETLQAGPVLRNWLEQSDPYAWAARRNVRLQRRETYSALTLTQAIKAAVTNFGPTHVRQLTSLIYEAVDDEEFYRAKMSIMGIANYMSRRGELTRVAPSMFALPCDEASERRGGHQKESSATEMVDLGTLPSS